MSKELILNYQDNNYFTNDDVFIFYDESFEKIFSSKVELYKGNWYTIKSLNFKCTSLKSCKL